MDVDAMKTPREIAMDIRPTHPHVTELICGLVRENERLREGWRSIAEGNLGDGPGQANYERIRKAAARALMENGNG